MSLYPIIWALEHAPVIDAGERGSRSAVQARLCQLFSPLGAPMSSAPPTQGAPSKVFGFARRRALSLS